MHFHGKVGGFPISRLLWIEYIVIRIIFQASIYYFSVSLAALWEGALISQSAPPSTPPMAAW